MECPGDIVAYNCSISSFAATSLELTWRVRIQDHMPITISYTNSSSVNMPILLSWNISVVLTAFEREEFLITSVIMLPVVASETRTQMQLECLSNGVSQSVTTFRDSGMVYYCHGYKVWAIKLLGANERAKVWPENLLACKIVILIRLFWNWDIEQQASLDTLEHLFLLCSKTTDTNWIGN